MASPKNMIVAQSGGPSPVINNSLRGLVETARDLPEIGTIYAGWHGIEGVLKEELRFLLKKYDHLTFYDAAYRKYGLGATEVRLFQKT